LGQFQVRLRDRVISPSDWNLRHGGRRIVTGLFTYLITHRKEPVPRHEILDTFWYSADGDKAATGLNRAISALRRVLEPALPNFASSSYIYLPQHYISLNPNLTIWVDAEEFEEAAKEGLSQEKRGNSKVAATAFRKALKLYRGDYMQDVPCAKVWCGPHRIYLRRLHTTILLRLAHLAEAQADPPLAIEYYQKVLAKEGCNETACQRLIALLLQMGDRSEALLVLETCKAVLKKKHGLKPCKATVDLYRQIVASPEGPHLHAGQPRSGG
jgi:DNA-binding SARP family transcriptional activator